MQIDPAKNKINDKVFVVSGQWSVVSGARALRERGAASIIATLFVLSASIVLLNFFAFSFANSHRIITQKINSQKTFYAAEAGIEDQVYRIKNQKNYTATNTLAVGSGQSNITISTSGNTKTILSEGILGSLIRRLQSTVTITTSEVAFHYGVQMGQGGLEMGQNAEIVGNVYSNGNIAGASGATISGDAIVAASAVESAQARSTVCNSDQMFGKTNPIIDMAQSFVAPTSEPLSKISIYIKKSGNPADRTVKITADSGGSPATTALASATLSASLVTTEYGWIDVVFSPPVSLASGSTYWIVFDADKNNSKYWHWCSDSNQGYSNGIGKYKQDWDDDGSWTQISGDLNFKTYFGTGLNSLDEVVVTGDAKSNAITNSKICGDAYYQSIDSESLDFLNSPSGADCGSPLTNGTAYPSSPDQPLQNMPISDANITAWKNDAAAGGQISGDLSITSNTSLGPKEITGNLSMVSNNKVLTITGTVYVHGYIDIANGSAIQCDASYGTNSCILIANGWIHVENNGTFRGSGQPKSFLMIMTTSNCDGTFSSGCTDHNAAVDIHNQATGVIFYVPNGMINLHNGVGVTEVTAYKLQLDNTATVTYSQGLANAQFSSGPGASWQINNWKEVE